jgi:hypothetical protein
MLKQSYEDTRTSKFKEKKGTYLFGLQILFQYAIIILNQYFFFISAENTIQFQTRNYDHLRTMTKANKFDY